MATLRNIRRRISGVKSTQKITKAMKMVAAAKFRRAQESIISARPYARKMKEMIRNLVTSANKNLNPLLQNREVKKVMMVIVTADRGLCGSFNTNLVKAAIQHINTNYKIQQAEGNLQLYCIGRRGYDFFSKRGYPVVEKKLNLFNDLKFAQAQEIAGFLVNGYLDGAYDKVEIVYNEFKSVVHQKIVIEQFLPLAQDESASESKEKAYGFGTDYIYEPSASNIVNSLIPKHLNFEIWRVLLESNAAEQGARMTAMDNATTNASELIDTLLLSYNKARQAAITKELLEIVSGAEALKKVG